MYFIFNPMRSGVIFSIILAFSNLPQSIHSTPGIFSINSIAIFLASLSFPAIKQSQSIGSGMFSSNELLILLNAAITLASVF